VREVSVGAVLVSATYTYPDGRTLQVENGEMTASPGVYNARDPEWVEAMAELWRQRAVRAE
jgi:hypothetical protein